MANSTLIDRDEECRALLRMADSGRPHLALVTGRRRVGKTFLLTHAWADRPFFLFTASRTTAEINRRQLVQDLSQWSGNELHPEDYPTWRSVFNLLFDFRANEPLIIVLDEFQYLADDAGGISAVASELNAAWERKRPVRSLLLVLSGSAVGTMEVMAAGGGPLYGRFAWHHRLAPFGYMHAAELAPFSDGRDRATAYGVFGGTPRYLAAIDVRAGLASNIARLLLDPTGEVRMLVETALDQEEGLREVPKYRSLLRAVAAGCTQRNEIAQRTGLPNDAGLRDKLNRLSELGYVETRANFDARPNEPVRYALADPVFRFHQQFVEPATSMLERYPADVVWTTMVEPAMDRYMGREFERIAIQAYDRRAAILGLPLVKRWGRWEGVDRDRQSLEIDLVAELESGAMLTGAVNWSRNPVSSELHREHLARLRRVAESGRGWGFRAVERGSVILYVSAAGFTDDFRRDVGRDSDYTVVCWSLEDLYS